MKMDYVSAITLFAENREEFCARPDATELLRLADHDGWTVAHAIAVDPFIGICAIIAAGLLSDELLRLTDNDGVSVLRTAIGSYQLSAIVRAKLLTREMLLLTDADGTTVAHCIAQSGQIGVVIAAGLLTTELLDMKNNDGESVAALCAARVWPDMVCGELERLYAMAEANWQRRRLSFVLV